MNIDAVIEPHIQTTLSTTTGQVEVTPSEKRRAAAAAPAPRVSQKLPLKVAVQQVPATTWLPSCFSGISYSKMPLVSCCCLCDVTTMFLSHLSSLLFGSIPFRRFADSCTHNIFKSNRDALLQNNR